MARPSVLVMRFTIFVAGVLAGSVALATPPSCDQISEAMLRQDDPAQVAADLQTTRARVNACAKLRRTRDGLAERRDQLHAARQERGLDQ